MITKISPEDRKRLDRSFVEKSVKSNTIVPVKTKIIQDKDVIPRVDISMESGQVFVKGVETCEERRKRDEEAAIKWHNSEVDAITFLVSPNFMGEKLLPFQSLSIKILYNLWAKYPVTPEEQNIIDILRSRWSIHVNTTSYQDIDKMIMALGRRSTKSSLMSFIATYTLYSLIMKRNPQSFYEIRDRHPIHIVHVAAKGEQAEEVFTLTSNNIRKTAFFKPYIDFDKDNRTELRLFTPVDLIANAEIMKANLDVPRGTPKASRLPGSLTVESITTAAATNRGKAIILLMLSELAHFERAKFERHDSDSEVTSENTQTDYAIVKALVPSVKDFGKDGKVIMESSPKEKGGEFYHQYCIGGGMDQEGFYKIVSNPGEPEHLEQIVFPEQGYQVLQLATWEARPTISRDDLESEFKSDPVGALMEYGARFGNPSGNFITEEMIEGMMDYDRQYLAANTGVLRFFISVDPGGKAKKKRADTYVVAWGHHEGGPNESDVKYIVDGMKGFNSAHKPLGDGRYEQIPVNPNSVTDFIVNLIGDMGGKNYIVEIGYDQFDSTSPIATLQAMGLPAIETTFTNRYKSEMYGNFLSKASNGQIRVYGNDPYGCVDQLKKELKHLQRVTSGNVTFYRHPETGPVTNDDYSDAVANLVHRMCMRVTPTIQTIEEHRKHNSHTGPIQRRSVVKPVMVGNQWSGAGGSRTNRTAVMKNKLRGRY